MAFVGYVGISTVTVKLKAGSMGHEEIAGVSRPSGLSRLNWGPKRWSLVSLSEYYSVSAGWLPQCTILYGSSKNLACASC